MLNSPQSSEERIRPRWHALAVLYLGFTAVLFRTVAIEANQPLISWYLGFELVFLILYTFGLFLLQLPGWVKHCNLVLQSAIVWYMISWRPEFDFLVVLFLLLSYPASLFFTGRTRSVWILVLVLLTGGSLIFYLGIIRGLALSLTTMAAEIVVPAFIVVNHEIEKARLQSQALLNELRETHQRLQSYASQVEELAAVQERNRLARELHDTVSQLIFSINLTSSSAQVLLKKDPTRVPEQLSRLQEMTTDALGRLRSLISQLRPPRKLKAQE